MRTSHSARGRGWGVVRGCMRAPTSVGCGVARVLTRAIPESSDSTGVATFRTEKIFARASLQGSDNPFVSASVERGSPDSPSSRRQQSTRMPPRSAPPAGNVCGEGVCGGAPNLGRARSRFHLTIFGASPSRCNSPAPKGGRSASPRRTRTHVRTACCLHTSPVLPGTARRPTDISGRDQFPRSDPPSPLLCPCCSGQLRHGQLGRGGRAHLIPAESESADRRLPRPRRPRRRRRAR